MTKWFSPDGHKNRTGTRISFIARLNRSRYSAWLSIGMAVLPVMSAAPLSARPTEAGPPQMIPPLLVASLFAIGALLVLIVSYVIVQKFINERARKRERELAAERARRERESQKSGAHKTDTVAQPAPVSLELDRSEHAELLENAREMVRDHPEKTAGVLRNWINQDS
ncbi:MAG: hypothetical protein KDK30_02845 [Leptospiraceae bacterium]|nr:hypothetical protein [Leptospiraceae bacterium]MCB1316384.1 hypothetical protein [Leptospiraceae bacterium]MCB1322977.1 hypothetical protein [Leptospiraceae bacterium]